MSGQPVSLVITSYEGRELLKRFLPDVIRALERYKDGGEVIVVDDGSDDGTPRMLADEFGGVKVVALDENAGFLPAANEGVKAARYEAMMLVNNDVCPDVDFLAPMVERIFGSDDIFAVCPRIIVPDGTDEAANRFEYDDGMLRHVQPGLGVTDKPFDRAVTVAFASGGCSLFRRSRFLELGFFDDLYMPGYYEDVDISWKAWRKGWRVVYEPASVVNHLSHATMEKHLGRDVFTFLHQRGMHLFHLRHLEWPLLEKYLWKVNSLASEGNLYDRGVLRRSFYKAVARLDEVMDRRKADESPARSTEDILEISSNRPV